jgi:hypothetical protein
MKIVSARVKNYRSIVDSEVVQLSERVTVLVGKNEQGKTTFLRALASINPKSRYAPGDLPNHLRASLEERAPSEIPIVCAWLLPDSEERDALSDILADADQIEEFILTRYYDAHYSYGARKKDGTEVDVRFTPPDISAYVLGISKAVGSLQARLIAHATRVTGFEPSLAQAVSNNQQFVKGNFSDAASVANLVTTYITALKALPSQDAAIQADIASAAKEIEGWQDQIQKALAQDPRIRFHALVPRFVFHSTSLDRIPNEVNVADFVKDPEATSKGMANLCLVAGLSTQKIQELAGATEISRRETYEDHFRASISGGINEFWTQESYNVHFRIEKEKLSLSISDNTYGRRISPSERSDGFQWYLSFYSALLSEVSSTAPSVVLLDNPGLELHADGQRDIKRFLEEKLPRNTQVIYVTHSPAMIDTFNLEQVRRVELRKDMEGTKVLPLALGQGLDLLEPVRSAVGASLVTTLISNDFNVLVEGASDKPILEAAFALFQPAEHTRIVINGSVSETGKLLPSFYERARLPYAIYLDADSGGRDIRSQLVSSGGIPEGRIVYLGDVIRRDGDFELEDIFHPRFYEYAVSQTYPDKEVGELPEGPGKTTKRYERSFGERFNIGFNKRRVAETVKKLLIQNGADAPDLDHLRALSSRIWEVLQRR